MKSRPCGTDGQETSGPTAQPWRSIASFLNGESGPFNLLKTHEKGGKIIGRSRGHLIPLNRMTFPPIGTILP